MKWSRVIMMILLLSEVDYLQAQDPVFTQSYANRLYLNPAFAGTDTVQHLGVNVRDFWPNISGSSIMYSISYDRNIFDSTWGMGIIANTEHTNGGLLITNNIDVAFAKQIHIGLFTLSIGFEGGMHEKTIQFGRMVFGDEIDPITGFIYPGPESGTRNDVTVPDFSAGLLGYGKNYFAGFAISHITQPDESFVAGTSPLPLKFTVNAGYIIPIGSFTFTPTALYENQQNFSMEMLQWYLTKGRFTFGAGYRFGDAILLTFGYKNKWMQAGYSFDYTTSVLGISSGGCHEISFVSLLHYNSTRLRKVSGINCPVL